MKMEPLKSGRLKIWMTQSDMQRFGLSFETMNARDDATRHAVLKLLNIAQQRYAFFSCDGLTVEALPISDGCLLLLTPGRHRPTFPVPQPTVYTIHSADDLLRFGNSLSQMPKNELPTASLFGWEQEYRLILYTDTATSESCKRLLLEFAEPIAHSYTAAAYTEEHGHALAVGNALQRLLTARGSHAPTPPDPPH